MIEFTCPNGHPLSADEKYAGTQVRCSQCQAVFVVPQVETPTQKPATQQPTPQKVEPASGGGPSVPPVVNVDTQGRDTERRPRGGGEFLGFSSMQWGKVAIFAGFALVIFARGCDGLMTRNVGRLQATLQQEEAEFDAETERRLADADPGDRADIQSDRRDARARADREDWADMQNDAAYARTSRAVMAYWTQWLFLLGSIGLTMGLLTVGFSGSGAVRALCLVMLAIILFSIYVGGAAWIESIASAVLPT